MSKSFEHRRFRHLAAAVGLAAIVAPAFAGCSEPPIIIPKGAWSVSFIDPGVECSIAGHNTVLGEVTGDTRTKLIDDGTEDTEVSCTVIENGSSYYVDALESSNGAILQILVNELPSNATKDMPAKGTVSYTSQNTAKAFVSQDCNFYFQEGTGQGASPGKVWLTFDCQEIAASSDNICTIDPGYAAFENCHSVDESE